MNVHPGSIMAYVQEVPDHRNARGKVYEWAFLWTIIVAAIANGCRTVYSIYRWMRGHREEIQEHLPSSRHRLPSLSTLYRVLRGVELAALEQQVSAHNQALAEQEMASECVEGPNGQVWYGQAVDGKTVRGASAHGRTVHMVALVCHGSGHVLAEVRVDSKSNELTAVPRLLAGRDLRGVVLTMDALLTQRPIAQQILEQQGQYLMVVKGNQPEMWEHIELLFRMPPQPAYEGETASYSYVEKGHGRLERRTLETSIALQGYLDWPGAAQVMRRTYHCVHLKSGKVVKEVTYGVTSLKPEEAGPRELERLWRGHWTIENRVHYVRDETMGEDRCQVHTGQAAQALVALRNGILSLLRHQGWSNIATALDYYRFRFHKTMQLIGVAAT